MLHTIEQTLINGAKALACGKYDDADQYYASVLAQQPNHCEANFQRGIIRADGSKASQALPFFTVALQADPNNARYWGGYIDTLIKLGFIKEAESAVKMITTKSGKNPSLDRLATRIALLTETSVLDETSGRSEAGNVLDSLQLPQALRLAERKFMSGSFTEAEQMYRDVLERFPNNKKAIAAIRRVTSEPHTEVERLTDPTDQDYGRLAKMISNGEFPRALSEIQTLQRIYPQSAMLFKLRGAAHSGLGELDIAVACYENAMTFDPHCSKTCHNLGGLLHAVGDVNAAIASFMRALSLQPDFPQASLQLGNVLHTTGDARAAIKCYVSALNYKSDFDIALYNFGATIKSAHFDKAAPEVSDALLKLLEKGTFMRPADVAAAAINLVQFEPAIELALDWQAKGVLSDNLEDVVHALGSIPLLVKIMALCPLPNSILEKLLTDIRATLLAEWNTLNLTENAREFCKALALQCYTNEYIYTVTGVESERLLALQTYVSSQIAKGQTVATLPLSILASYRSLSDMSWSKDIVPTVEIETLFQRQIREPGRQAQQLQQIKVFQEISDMTSSRVRDQYEENPYPRWIHCHIGLKAIKFAEALKRRQLRFECCDVTQSEAPEILIAGCGTGQTAIETAAEIGNCSIQAVDLSMSSLTYAKFKADQLGFNQIDFMQADILDLSKMGRRFDFIESTGVLHHMEEPMAGWRILESCLKPGGMMKIALYSETARKTVALAREEIARLEIPARPVEMKQYRQRILTHTDPKFQALSGFSDFYALSEFRDLLFHEQEHQFTLQQLKECLEELNLNFCGFEAGIVTEGFKAQFGDDSAPYDLDLWCDFETENPNSFVGMYQFWCQKPV
ncbi:MAG: tetratricopeptide repeat protein [Roseobacter sp.]